MILPNAPALPAAFARRLLAWVEQGGTLIATGPVGAWDEYGRPNGLLLDAALGPSNWTREGRALRLRDGLADTETRTVEVRSPAAFLVERRLGKGAVIIRQGAFPPERLYRAVAAAAPRRFYGENNRFHLVLRQDKTGVAGKPGSLYLSVLNPDCHRPREDELVVAGAYRDIADISCGFPIPSSIRDGQTRFSIRLGPAETAMIRIRP